MAIKVRGCLTLIERTTRYSPVGEPTSATLASLRMARSAIWKNEAWYENRQEDPVGIDVNAVRDWVRWKSTRKCIRSARGWDRTTHYEPTGWKRTEYNEVPFDWYCGVATESTYAKFRGGQFFPACLGSKVTTFYANNIAQGFPRGKFKGRVYKKTGGAPCRKLLRWRKDSKNETLP